MDRPARAVVAERRSAVPAHVEERSQFTVAVTDEQQRHAAHGARRPGPRFGQLVGHAGAHPPAAVHAARLVLEERGVGVPHRRQRAGGGDAGWVGDVPELDRRLAHAHWCTILS